MSSDKRILFITVDGDGFMWKANYDSRCVAEIFKDEIIKTYPFFFTASITVGDIFKYSDDFSLELARKIFRLGNVEAASHSWSHPHSWQNYKINLKHEINDSIGFINQEILPKGKKVKIFLWTGKCNPTERGLEILDRLNISNLNGNKIQKSFIQVSKYRHFMSRAYPDWYYMKLGEICPGSNAEKNYRILSSYNGKLDGFKDVVNYFKRTPYSPIHLWLHWYSAVRRDSLDALKFVLDWCLKQNTHSIFASQYVSLMQRRKLGEE